VITVYHLGAQGNGPALSKTGDYAMLQTSEENEDDDDDHPRSPIRVHKKALGPASEVLVLKPEADQQLGTKSYPSHPTT